MPTEAHYLCSCGCSLFNAGLGVLDLLEPPHLCRLFLPPLFPQDLALPSFPHPRKSHTKPPFHPRKPPTPPPPHFPRYQSAEQNATPATARGWDWEGGMGVG